MVENAVDEAALENLLADLGGAREPVRDLIISYLAEAPAIVDRIRAAIALGQAEEMARAAHSLKSSSSVLGAKRISTLALELENLGRSGSLSGAREKLVALAASLTAARRELTTWAERT